LSALLEIRGLRKSYGSVAVLRDVDFDVQPGEIHALLGENGAGKSTLIKILAGVVQSDAGELIVDGVPLPEGHSPDDAKAARISFVHQDLGLIDELSVAENIALEVGYRKRSMAISFAATRRFVQELLAEIGATFDAGRLVGSLTRDEKVLCALARAFAQEARVIVLDEVSASLPAPELDRLAGVIRKSRRHGVAYVYVTHRLGEVFALADRVTVLRDGVRVLDAASESTDHDSVVRAILGVELAAHTRPEREPMEDVKPVFTVSGLAGDDLSSPANLEVAPGEVLGVCGLVGSGTRSLASLLNGTARKTTGEVKLDGTRLKLGNATAMSDAGVVFVPGDRKRQGLYPTLSVRENLYPVRRGDGEGRDRAVRSTGGERRDALELCKKFDVRPVDAVEAPIAQLSGGNQQKVVFARALRVRPRLLVLEDPTAGVDVGSRAILYELIEQAAQSGTAVILISTDFEEIASEVDRALVMCDGEIVSELAGDEVTAGRLAAESYGLGADNMLLISGEEE
jgi:ribose transport system ATP-binding protein